MLMPQCGIIISLLEATNPGYPTDFQHRIRTEHGRSSEKRDTEIAK